MAVVVAGPGAATFGLFALAGVPRIADIATTDGTTHVDQRRVPDRPGRGRLAVQAVVEGIGVPVAIGVTGALLLALNVLDLGIGAVIAFGLVLGVVWTVVAVAVYRSYTRALGDEMRRRSLVDGRLDLAEDDVRLRALLRSDDARDVRLGLDLLSGAGSTTATIELRQVAGCGGSRSAGAGAHPARREGRCAGGTELAGACRPPFPIRRGGRPPRGRGRPPRARRRPRRHRVLVALLDDRDPTVRAAALDGVTPDDAAGRRSSVASSPRSKSLGTAGSATAAIRRLGDTAVPLVSAALARDGAREAGLPVRAAATAAREARLGRHRTGARRPDRAVVLAALEASARRGAAIVPPQTLDRCPVDAAAHAARALAPVRRSTARDGPLRERWTTSSTWRAGSSSRCSRCATAIESGAAVRVVEHADGQRRALGVEALDVVLSREEAPIALPLVRRDPRTPASRPPAAPHPEEWIADIADDPDGVWRSSWLAACARYAAAPLPGGRLRPRRALPPAGGDGRRGALG